ncbi:MAG: plasmid stabilization protein [Geobacter sp.]|nr:MAG: plasmid stabilization protein [Geobacter sp.]
MFRAFRGPQAWFPEFPGNLDSLIAATAAAHGLIVVTHNVKDMERCWVRVCNPWE